MLRMDPPVIAHLFVYGTLQPALAPPSLREVVDRFTLVGRGRTRGLLYDLGRYPGASFDASSDAEVHGAVYAVPDDPTLWQRLDGYEGVPSLYLRVRRQVTLDDDTQLACWMYEYQRPVHSKQLVSDGRYRR